MSRPLRIEEPGLWHHVMNRGLERRDILVEEEDFEDFLGLVGEVGPRWDVWSHAVCLLGNHYHLLVHDEGGALGRAMRHINGVHTQRFNRRHGRDGQLMRGRYRSRLVQEEGYLLEVIRYLHTNPTEAGLVRRAGDHPWSSHRHDLQPEAPNWLRRDAVYDRFGADDEGRAAFDAFVHERIPDEIRSELAPRRGRDSGGPLRRCLAHPGVPPSPLRVQVPARTVQGRAKRPRPIGSAWLPAWITTPAAHSGWRFLKSRRCLA